MRTAGKSIRPNNLSYGQQRRSLVRQGIQLVAFNPCNCILHSTAPKVVKLHVPEKKIVRIIMVLLRICSNYAGSIIR
jgi:hypothetical protein